ncbi:MAG TPA: hypothetical protein VK173_10775, partial [Lacibacter sp.]|nr:hypothetical protein [Lacibacter sp.]
HTMAANIRIFIEQERPTAAEGDSPSKEIIYIRFKWSSSTPSIKSTTKPINNTPTPGVAYVIL